MTWYLTVLSADGQLWEAEAWETKLKSFQAEKILSLKGRGKR